ncbi:MAG TPA: PAS domain S-box protein, partial [Anaerolineae bacterium]
MNKLLRLINMPAESKTPNAQELNRRLNEALRRIAELEALEAAREQTGVASRETEERLRAMTEAMPIPMIITRFSDTLILAGNARLGELFGLPTQEMIGRLAREFIYSQKEFRRMMLEVLRQGSLRDREVRAKKADGSPIWIAASSEKMTFNGVPALVSSFYDLDERKKTEEALRQQAAELLARNAELDAFAHTVAHDLKSPLSIILGYADLLIEAGTELDPRELLEYLTAIRQTTLKVNNIVDELLLLAEVRKFEVEMQPLNMAKIVADSRRRLAYL